MQQLFILLLISFMMPLKAQATDPIILKFSHVVASNTPKGKAAEKLKELVETRTKGQMKVEIYPNSQLYKDREELEALQLGAVQLLAPSLSKFGPLGAREFEIFDLPFLFPDKKTLYTVMDGEIGRRLFKKLESKNIQGLAFWDNGFKQMSANRPLHDVSDFKGLKLRIQSSKVLESQMKALGANPQVMAFSEVYSALQQGVVDGTENPLSNLYTQKMHEVQKHLTLSNHGYLGYALIINKHFWENLPQTMRTIFEQAIKEVTVYERQIAQQENDEALEKIKASGRTIIYTLTPQQHEMWYQALLPVQNEFQTIVGKENLESIRQLTQHLIK